MVNAVPSRLGQQNAAGGATALFLKVYSGEVMTAFETATVFKERHVVRRIQSGLSAQFPILGRIGAAYHTPGAEIVGTALPANERVITVDDILHSHAFIADWDAAVNHYETRSHYSRETGLALAYQFDRTIAQLGVLAARSAAIISGGAVAQESGGGVIVSATSGTSGSALATAFFDAAETLDVKDVPDGDRFGYLRPAQYYNLAETTSVINKDWGGAGSYADGKVLRVAGIDILKTNNLPSTNITTGPTAYQGNFTAVTGLVMNKRAVGTVMLMDVSTRADYDPRRLGTLVVSKMLFGSNFLRPACSVSIQTA